MFDRYLIVWLCLLSGLAYQWTDWFPQLWDPFVGSKPVLSYLFALTMVAIGWMLPRDEVRQVFRRWPTVLYGTATQFTAMPLLAWGVAELMGFTGPQRTGLILVGSVPGAMASNVLTLAARGNVSYSVSLTTTSTLLSPLVVPLALMLTLGRSVPLDAAAVSWNLCWTVVLPVVSGHLLNRSFPQWEKAAHRVGSVVAHVVILWIIACVVAVNREQLSAGEQMGSLLPALLAINILGFAAGYGAASLIRMPEPMRRALSLEVAMQNAGLGSILAMRFFPDQPGAAIPCALYTFGCVLTAALMARLWTWRE